MPSSAAISPPTVKKQTIGWSVESSLVRVMISVAARQGLPPGTLTAQLMKQYLESIDLTPAEQKCLTNV